jgi:hypothetical protein
MRSGRYLSDAAAAQDLYASAPSDTRYSTLKSRLKSRLINSLFQLNLRQAGFSEYADATYHCQRRAFLAQTLLSMGARNAGVKMATRALDQAILYHLTAITYNMALLLRNHSSLVGGFAKYEQYDLLVKTSLRTLAAECASWEYLERTQAIANQFTSPGQEYIDRTASYVRELESLYGSESSFTFALNFFRLEILHYSSIGQHTQILKAASDALLYLNTHGHLSSAARLAEFTLSKLDCYIALRDYPHGIQAASECSKLLKVGTNTWFSFADRHLRLLLHTEHFLEAETLFQTIVENPRFATLPEVWKERFKIYELYLSYALRSIPEYESLPLRRNFDLQAFLRFVPTASKDKHGMHIAVLIIHILYMLEAKDFSGIIDRMDSLRTYRSRYLRTAANRRSSIFLKMLTIMENNSFSYKLTNAKTERYYDQLLTEASEETETDEDFQVIPYEWLWQRVLDKLESYEQEYSRATVR